jgi:hypothetical protein
MKLDRWLVRMVFVGAASLAACGQPAPSGSPPAVGTAQLRAADLPSASADLPSASEVPRVGKPQHDELDADVDEELPSKVEPARRERRPAGGLSGYK